MTRKRLRVLLSRWIIRLKAQAGIGFMSTMRKMENYTGHPNMVEDQDRKLP